jgi:hypothetical protein
MIGSAPRHISLFGVGWAASMLKDASMDALENSALLGGYMTPPMVWCKDGHTVELVLEGSLRSPPELPQPPRKSGAKSLALHRYIRDSGICAWHRTHFHQ